MKLTNSKLRDELAEIFMGLKDGTVTLEVAAERNNTAGKMLKSAALDLAYSEAKKEKPDIAFMEGK